VDKSKLLEGDLYQPVEYITLTNQQLNKCEKPDLLQRSSFSNLANVPQNIARLLKFLRLL